MYCHRCGKKLSASPPFKTRCNCDRNKKDTTTTTTTTTVKTIRMLPRMDTMILPPIPTKTRVIVSKSTMKNDSYVGFIRPPCIPNQPTISDFQREVFTEIKQLYPDAELEHKIVVDSTLPNGAGTKSVDIYIPCRKLVIECDGGGHSTRRTRQKDRLRQFQIESLGYRMVRIKVKVWKLDKNIFRYI